MMGTPLPAFTEAAETCSCFGSGTGNGLKTPKYIRVRISGTEHGPLWVPAADDIAQDVYQLTERIGFDCEWLFLWGGLEVILRMGGGVAGGVFLSLINTGDFFHGPSAEACVTSYVGGAAAGGQGFFIGGIAELEFGEGGE